MMKKTDLAEFRHLLLGLRARVQGDVQHLSSEALDRNEGSESKSPTHLAELGTDTYEQDFALQRMENEQDLLEEIDSALERLDSGTYGFCETCLESGLAPAKSAIPKTRLRVLPYARNCVECQARREEYSL